MYSAVSHIAYKQYTIKQPSLLSAKDKIEVAKNILKLDGGIIDELFPK